VQAGPTAASLGTGDTATSQGSGDIATSQGAVGTAVFSVLAAQRAVRAGGVAGGHERQGLRVWGRAGAPRKGH
jgi:hypothetical protein